MKDSWRAGIPESDKTDLVTTGIFRISRNPAFLAFDLVYWGVLLMFFNWILLLFNILAWFTPMLNIGCNNEADADHRNSAGLMIAPPVLFVHPAEPPSVILG